MLPPCGANKGIASREGMWRFPKGQGSAVIAYQTRSPALAMKLEQKKFVRTIGIAAIAALLILFYWAMSQGPTVRLTTPNGQLVAVAHRPRAWLWQDKEWKVSAGKTNLFSLGDDFVDSPLYIYPFADGRRFLCIYDYDVAVLVFVVDLTGSPPSPAQLLDWPPNADTRQSLYIGATNVVLNTKGVVRLPLLSEVREAASYLTTLTQSELEAKSFSTLDFGFYRDTWPKKGLLEALDTNRQRTWP